jgi:hypothetical protein
MKRVAAAAEAAAAVPPAAAAAPSRRTPRALPCAAPRARALCLALLATCGAALLAAWAWPPSRAFARVAAAELARARLLAGASLRGGGSGGCVLGPLAVFSASSGGDDGGGSDGSGDGAVNIVLEASAGCADVAVEVGATALPASRARDACGDACAHLGELRVAHAPAAALLAAASGAGGAARVRVRAVARGGAAAPPVWLRAQRAAPAGAAARLALVSDSQSGARVFRELLSRIAQQHAAPAAALDVLVHGGDAVQAARDAREAALYLLAPLADFYSDLGYAVPALLVRGNHDDPARFAALTRPPPALAAAAAGGPPPPGFRRLALPGALRALVLDADDAGEAQLQWLRRECAGGRRGGEGEFTLALAHVPPVVEFWAPAAWRAGESAWPANVRDRLVPALRCCAAARVRLLVSGHAHLYARGAARAPAPGEQCGGGGGGAPAPLALATIGGGGGALEDTRVAPDAGVYAVTALAHHFATLEVRGGGAHWRAFGLDGAQIDEERLPPLKGEGVATSPLP